MEIEIYEIEPGLLSVAFTAKDGACLIATSTKGRLGEIEWDSQYWESLPERRRENASRRFDALEEECWAAWRARNKLSTLRKKAGLTQPDFGFFIANTTTGRDSAQPTVSKMERGTIAAGRQARTIYALLSVMTPQQIANAKRVICDLDAARPAD